MPRGGQPKSIVPYADVIALFERAREAINDGKPGIRATYPTPKAALQAQWKMGAAIRRLQERSKELFPLEDPRHGRAGFEDIAMYAEGFYVVLRKAEIPRDIITIEDLEL
jgi:hypothetical protein